MHSAEFRIRRMNLSDAREVAQWAAAEGWNPGLVDADCFFEIDQTGFFLGQLDGMPITCIACLAYDDRFGFLGLYITRPEYRGKGYGLATWKTGMAHLGERNIGLDGVLEQVENYERSGFKKSHFNIRHRLVGGGTIPQGVVALDRFSFDEVAAYDARCFPASRVPFLQKWISQTDAIALGVQREGRLAGFGVLRRAQDGFKAAPVFADDIDCAQRLFQGLISHAPRVAVSIDVPETIANAASADFVKRFGMQPVFTAMRMYTRGIPDVEHHKIFGITSMEAG